MGVENAKGRVVGYEIEKGMGTRSCGALYIIVRILGLTVNMMGVIKGCRARLYREKSGLRESSYETVGTVHTRDDGVLDEGRCEKWLGSGYILDGALPVLPAHPGIIPWSLFNTCCPPSCIWTKIK